MSLATYSTAPAYGIQGLGDIPQVPTVRWVSMPMGAFGTEPTVTTYSSTGGEPKPFPTWAIPVVVVGVAAVIGLAIWSMKQKYEIMKVVAEKEGGSGVLKMEAGEALGGLVGALGASQYRSNRRRRSRRRW